MILAEFKAASNTDLRRIASTFLRSSEKTRPSLEFSRAFNTAVFMMGFLANLRFAPRQYLLFTA